MESPTGKPPEPDMTEVVDKQRKRQAWASGALSRIMGRNIYPPVVDDDDARLEAYQRERARRPVRDPPTTPYAACVAEFMPELHVEVWNGWETADKLMSPLGTKHTSGDRSIIAYEERTAAIAPGAAGWMVTFETNGETMDGATSSSYWGAQQTALRWLLGIRPLM